MTAVAVFDINMRSGIKMEVPDDEALGAAAAAGDVAAFETLARRYQVPLMRFLSRFAHRVEDAEDALQETFCRLYAGRTAYRRRWRYRTWAFTIARRTAVDLHRNRARHGRVEGLQDRAISVQPTLQHVDADDLWILVRRILSHESSQALWLCYVEQMPAREIARILGRTSMSVKTLLFRARRDLKRAMETGRRGQR